MSRFLPDNFDASKPLALIAGKGTYPILLAERARSAGIAVRLIELGGETSEKLISSFPVHERSAVKVGQVGKLLKELKKFNAGYAVMAGQVTPGNSFADLHPDLKAIRMLAGLDRKNAETIFGAIGDEIEKSGVHLLDARVFMDEDMTEEGMMVKGKEKIDPQHLAHGIEIARENARLDVGQGVVVSRGTVSGSRSLRRHKRHARTSRNIWGKKLSFRKTRQAQSGYTFRCSRLRLTNPAIAMKDLRVDK